MYYYFPAAALPDLQIGCPPEMRFHEFDVLLRNNLNEQDYAQAQTIRRFYDIQNIRAFWKKEPLDTMGNFDENTLEEAILTGEGLPGYVYAFLEKYDNTESRLHHFSALVATFFQEEIKEASGFLKEYLSFERSLRLVLMGFRAKKMGRGLATELQYEDPDDDLVAQILAQKDAKTYEPPSGFEGLKVLFEEHYEAPLDLFQALCEYRFCWLGEAFDVRVFSIDRILAYMVQLIMAEKWMDLDREKGMTIVDKIVKEGA